MHAVSLFEIIERNIEIPDAREKQFASAEFRGDEQI
jgi:hypothetical protein